MPNRSPLDRPPFFRRRASWCHPRETGFSLLEILIVLAVITIIASLAIPAMLTMIARAKMDGTVRGVLALLAQARSEAVRRGVPVVVEVDLVNHRLEAFADVNAETGLVADVMVNNPTPAVPYRTTDYEVGHYDLDTSGATGIYFWGAADNDPGGADAVDGFSDNSFVTAGAPTLSELVVFESDGSLRDPGSIRLAMGPFPRAVAATDDYERNFFEVITKLEAVGRFEVRKWIPDKAVYEVRSKATDGTPNWKWY